MRHPVDKRGRDAQHANQFNRAGRENHPTFPSDSLARRGDRGFATASRPPTVRRGRHDHTMLETNATSKSTEADHYPAADTSGCVGGASGVPPTQSVAGEAFNRQKTAGKSPASGTSGVYLYHARSRTRTPARGHTYARLHKVGIPPTSPTRVGGSRRTYQNTEMSQ